LLPLVVIVGDPVVEAAAMFEEIITTPDPPEPPEPPPPPVLAVPFESVLYESL
jgi:hypothetical protein